MAFALGLTIQSQPCHRHGALKIEVQSFMYPVQRPTEEDCLFLEPSPRFLSILSGDEASWLQIPAQAKKPRQTPELEARSRAHIFVTPRGLQSRGYLESTEGLHGADKEASVGISRFLFPCTLQSEQA